MAYQHITIKRIPVNLDLAMSDNHNAAVQREERLANAAPELLAALQAVANLSEILGVPLELVEQMRAAIAEATGVQS